MLSCPNKALKQCLTDLDTAKSSLGRTLDSNANLKIALEDANKAIAILTAQLNQGTGDQLAAMTKQRDDLLTLSKLLTEGPEIPDQSKVKWLQASYIQACLYEAFPGVMDKVPLEMQLWSDDDYLVCPADQIKLFLDYYTMFWLPNINPYTVISWTKLNGQKVDIYAIDCDDFSDFLQGLPAINPKWACFPWGTMWGQVEGLLMAGGHAFSWMICCDDDYMEVSPSMTPTKGLHLYIIEPQMGQQWSVTTPAGVFSKAEIIGYELKEVKGFFAVKEIWMTKV